MLVLVAGTPKSPQFKETQNHCTCLFPIKPFIFRVNIIFFVSGITEFSVSDIALFRLDDCRTPTTNCKVTASLGKLMYAMASRISHVHFWLLLADLSEDSKPMSLVWMFSLNLLIIQAPDLAPSISGSTNSWIVELFGVKSSHVDPVYILSAVFLTVSVLGLVSRCMDI